MRSKLDDVRTRARFLRAYARTSSLKRATLAAGLTPSTVRSYRHRHADFREQCAAAVAGTLVVAKIQAELTPARRARLIEALAEQGSIIAACRRADVAIGTAYNLRRRDAAFAAAWAEAREQAMDRVEDELFTGALGGFVQTSEKAGVVTTRRAQNPSAMFKLLAGRHRPGRGPRTVELTPALLAEARSKFEAALRRAAETGEVPPPALVTLPPPTVSAWRTPDAPE